VTDHSRFGNVGVHKHDASQKAVDPHFLTDALSDVHTVEERNYHRFRTYHGFDGLARLCEVIRLNADQYQIDRTNRCRIVRGFDCPKLEISNGGTLYSKSPFLEGHEVGATGDEGDVFACFG